jgi:isoleucyl-tRNA synthetase
MSDYKKTLNLPATTFPMKASLTQNEPKVLEGWYASDAYGAMVSANDGKETYVLHDGPPYANGHIHIGHAMNKILKDVIVKHRNMTGRKAQYVPGWDCHGLPIELKVEQELGGKDKYSILEIRQKCREYALKYLDIQREEFKRLGVLGTWDKPYLTMTPQYEAATARELANFYKKGSVQRNKKPIYWCGSCETALAEAEVEYDDHSSPSIYVRFPLEVGKLADVFPQAVAGKTFIVIWTTTPWTIPDNLAVAVHPDFEYDLVQAGDSFYILAKELAEISAAKFGWDEYKALATVPGSALEGLVARHPFYDRPSPVVTADYVTLDAGTGCVHTAPGHGREDYETGLRHGLEILSPLDDQARFLPSVEFFGGKNVFEANPLVMDKLTEVGHLLGKEKIRHSYPHCWRCKKPVIFRATTQWFIAMEADNLRAKTLDAIDSKVRWIPSWGKERIHSMIKFRPDWCISRQRMWGVPIIALLCADCGDAWFDGDWAHSIVDRFATHPTGADYWFETPLADVVPKGLTCPKCGGSHWEKEDDILDVWFDSGTSYAAVVEGREECSFPADLYLEGTDQHRGWFHSSLLASMGTRGVPPYKSVLTHGFVLDGQGRKMSKSIGNVVAPQEIIEKHGAEVLRLWVASTHLRRDHRPPGGRLPQDPQHLPLHPRQPERLRPGHGPGGHGRHAAPGPLRPEHGAGQTPDHPGRLRELRIPQGLPHPAQPLHHGPKLLLPRHHKGPRLRERRHELKAPLGPDRPLPHAAHNHGRHGPHPQFHGRRDLPAPAPGHAPGGQHGFRHAGARDRGQPPDRRGRSRLESGLCRARRRDPGH